MILRKTAHKRVSCEQGFTLIELAIVIIVIGIMVTAGVVAFYATTRATDVKTAAEVIKKDLQKVYGFAASGEKPDGIDYRFRYRVIFNNNSDTPKNCYVIERGTPDGSGTYTYVPMTPEPSEAVKINGNFIIPGSMSETQIDYGTNKIIYFVSVGSIIMANTTGNTTPGGDMTIIINGHGTSNITVSGYGNVSGG